MRRKNASWERHSVHTFCDLCIREIESGNRPGTHLTKDGWRNVLHDFVNLTDREYDRHQLKNKWDLLKKEWKQWKQLLENETGIQWDSKKDTVDASNSWWEEKLKVLPEAKKFRCHGIEPELEEKLDKMFLVVGDLEEYASVPSDADDLDKPKTRGRRKLTEKDSKSENLALVLNTPKTNEPSKRRKLIEGINSEEKSQKLALVAQNDPPFPDLIETRSTATSIKQCETKCSITDAIHLLDSLEEVPKASQLYYFAIKLILDRDKREVFMALSPEIKVWWLKMEELESRK